MKPWRLRFTLRTLLVVSTVFAVVCWYWVEWPRRTLARLSGSMARGDFERANELVTACSWTATSNDDVRFDLINGPMREPYPAPADEWRLIFQEALADLRLEPRSASDVLAARGRLILMGRHKIRGASRAGDPVPMFTPRFEFTAQRGSISVRVILVTNSD